MAAANILVIGTTALDSSDVVVAAGTPLTVGLKGVVDGKASVIIKLRDDGGAYNVVGALTSINPATVINAPGTYRFSREAGGSCGVYSA